MKPTFEDRAARLTGRIREEETSKRLGEVRIFEQRQDLDANVCAHVVRRSGDVTHNLRLKPSTVASVGMTSMIW